jgi:CMP-2-keto-3-deoxyoctulosonic acid synthetase
MGAFLCLKETRVEIGISIKMIETESASIGIDTPEDLELARRLYKER